MPQDVTGSLESSLSGTKKFLHKQTQAMVDAKAKAVIDGDGSTGLPHQDEWKKDLLSGLRVVDTAVQKPRSRNSR